MASSGTLIAVGIVGALVLAVVILVIVKYCSGSGSLDVISQGPFAYLNPNGKDTCTACGSAGCNLSGTGGCFGSGSG